MRFLLSTLIALMLAGGGLLLLDRGMEVTHAALPAGIDDVRERVGVRRMLAEKAQLDFSLLAVGTADGDMRDFRGSILEAGRNQPVFGQARRLCLKGLDTPECWEVALMQVDGRQVLPVAEPLALPAAAPAPELETADLPPAPPADAAPAVAPEPAATASAVPEVAEAPATPAAPGPTHRVARPQINARAGPGTGNAVVGRLVEGDELALLEATGGWGRFQVVSGADNGAEVWVALRILEPLEGRP